MASCTYYSVIISVNFLSYFRPSQPDLPTSRTTNEIMSNNDLPFSSKKFNSFLSGLGIKHTTPSPNYPQSDGFIERQVQTVKRVMEKANATGRNFQEALTSVTATPLGDGMPSSAVIFHGRSLVTRKKTSVDLTAVHQHLISLQAKYIKHHDKARWARSQRPLVIGEEVYHSTSGNNWVNGTVSGTQDSGRSYDILTEEGTSLRNRSHLKPQSYDIPMLNQYFNSRTSTPSLIEINSPKSLLAVPAHPPKEKYSNNNNTKYSLLGTSTPSQREIFYFKTCHQMHWRYCLCLLHCRDIGSTEECHQTQEADKIWRQPCDQC